MEGVCRVCLAQDCNVYRVVNMALEQTYDVITSVKLQRADRPTALCCICVSQLRRCRRFIETARKSNATLDLWYTAQKDFKLTARSLFSFTKTTTETIDIDELEVKQEPTESYDSQDDDGAFTMYETKREVIYDDVESDPLHESNDENDSIQRDDDDHDDTQTTDDEQNTTHLFDNDETNTQISDDENNKTKSCQGVKRNISNRLDDNECMNLVDIENDKTQVSADDEEIAILKTDNERSRATPYTSNVGGNLMSCQDQDTGSRRLRSGKLIKLEKDISSTPVFKRQRLIPARLSANIDTASTPQKKRNMLSISQRTFTTTSKKNLTRHLIQSDQKQFVCNICDFKFNRKYHLITHLLRHSGQKLFQCIKCDYKTNHKGNLKQHIMIHSGQKLFQCDKCDYETNYKRSLKQHIMIHSGQKPFKCDKCDYKCSQKFNLKCHLMKHVDKDEKPFACDKCQYRCGRKDTLKIHLMKHSNNKPFQCDKCGYKCSEKGNFKRHLMIHDDKKPFKCDKCNYTTYRKDVLKNHNKSRHG